MTRKYEAPIFTAIEERKFTSLKPIKFHKKLESFTAKLSAADKYVNSILDKYVPKPEEIAACVLFLIENRYITGEVIDVNGGRYMD